MQQHCCCCRSNNHIAKHTATQSSSSSSSSSLYTYKTDLSIAPTTPQSSDHTYFLHCLVTKYMAPSSTTTKKKSKWCTRKKNATRDSTHRPCANDSGDRDLRPLSLLYIDRDRYAPIRTNSRLGYFLTNNEITSRRRETTRAGAFVIFIRAKRVSNCYMQEKNNGPFVCPDVRIISWF